MGWVELKIFNPTQPANSADWEFNNPTQPVKNSYGLGRFHKLGELIPTLLFL